MQKYLFIVLLLLVFRSHAKSDVKLISSESLELSLSEVVIDGGAVLKIDCPHSLNSENNFFKTFMVGGHSMEIHCNKDYNGGYYVFNPMTKERIMLSQKDGDEGVSWDQQSIIFSNSNKLILWNINYSLHDLSIDCKTMTDLEKKRMSEVQRKKHDLSCIQPGFKCSQVDSFYEWDKKSSFTKRIAYKGKLPKRKLMPFEQFTKNCTL